LYCAQLYHVELYTALLCSIVYIAM